MNNSWKKNIALFLGGQTISLFGSALVQYAITWYITLETQSGIMMTISIICGFLPTFFISPFGGVWADRYNRRLLIILADSMIAIATLVLAILFLLGYTSIWLLFIASAIRALGSGIQNPAIGSLFPQIVPEDKLTKVNSIDRTINSFVTIVSPMLSGALLAMSNIEVIFFIDVITAVIGILILIIFVKTPIHARALERNNSSYFNDMKEGIEYIKNHSFIKKFFLYAIVFYFLSTPVFFLTTLQVTRNFGEEIWRLTMLEVIFSVGMMAGGIFMSIWEGFKNKTHTMVLGFSIVAISIFILGVIPIFWIYLAFIGITGFSILVFDTPATVLLQQKVEEEFLGRIFGVLRMISSIVLPIGMTVFGPLADIIDINWLLIISGLLMLVQSFYMFRSKELIKAGGPIN
ncbi:MFS transporter [Clostridium isatidis]|uniref:MFS transporter n=1 Tax=Clostridium isatidis TaxID=182773 RepID=A0A343JCC9_9CLOT|nr:MFS transporter [Clostridium isatidis]ASW43187.1 MFS transporter [Clostridium isatidis]NLZ33724.1 MFS transporter [Clostridiales bacterium]